MDGEGVRRVKIICDEGERGDEFALRPLSNNQEGTVVDKSKRTLTPQRVSVPWKTRLCLFKGRLILLNKWDE